jgi:hypothetical protein
MPDFFEPARIAAAESIFTPALTNLQETLITGQMDATLTIDTAYTLAAQAADKLKLDNETLETAWRSFLIRTPNQTFRPEVIEPATMAFGKSCQRDPSVFEDKQRVVVRPNNPHFPNLKFTVQKT